MGRQPEEDAMKERQRFADQVVVVTGGGAGIGRVFAHRFAAEGASIVIADRDADAGQRVVAELETEGRGALAVSLDVRDTDGAAAMAAAAAGRLGGIDVLINNAGVHLEHAQLPSTLDAIPLWRNVFDVNVIGALICVAACREAMAARGGGSVLNVSSMAAYMGSGAYGASKLALNSLTVSLAVELGPAGVRVNGIAPGLVDSEAAVEWWSAPGREGIQEGLVAAQIIKRQGRMDDLADMALFLCSDEASFVTGQTILVDGGFTKKPA
jgi:NAD(P)-dependent dehydrogenase (short-subunit alcohol dehydrogenase family)